MDRSLCIDSLFAFAIPEAPALVSGRRVVYVLRTVDRDADKDRRSLWLARADRPGQPARLTFGDADFSPSVSPDGTDIAFLRDRGDGCAQLWLLPLDGGEARQLTDLQFGGGRATWSADGSQLAFCAPVARANSSAVATVVADTLGYKADGNALSRSTRQHVHVLNLESGRTKQVTEGDWNAGEPSWSSDGRRLAFAAALEPGSDVSGASAAYQLDVTRDGAEPVRVGSASGSVASALWSADGTALFVVARMTTEAGRLGLWRLALRDGAAWELTQPLDRNVMVGAHGYPGGGPLLTSSGRSVLVCVRHRGSTHLYEFDERKGGAYRAIVSDPDVVLSGLSVLGDEAAVIRADQSTPGEVAIVDLPSATVTVLTEHNRAALAHARFPRRQSREFHISDGTTVHGWLLRESDAPVPAPLLLDIHGGPHNAWTPAADTVRLYHYELLARGWSVLLLNPRGSDGYGERHWRGAVGNYGYGDEADLLEPLDQLIAEGEVDGTRLAVTGYSYGGFMTCHLTTSTDRFAAAVAGGAYVDLESMAGTSDLGMVFVPREHGAFPFEDEVLIRRQSPIARVDAVTTPTLVLHGLDDNRCPVGQGEQWFSALRARGVPSRLVVYPGSHQFVSGGLPSVRADYNRRVVSWVTEHVDTASRPEPRDAMAR